MLSLGHRGWRCRWCSEIGALCIRTALSVCDGRSSELCASATLSGVCFSLRLLMWKTQTVSLIQDKHGRSAKSRRFQCEQKTCFFLTFFFFLSQRDLREIPRPGRAWSMVLFEGCKQGHKDYIQYKRANHANNRFNHAALLQLCVGSYEYLQTNTHTYTHTHRHSFWLRRRAGEASIT